MGAITLVLCGALAMRLPQLKPQRAVSARAAATSTTLEAPPRGTVDFDVSKLPTAQPTPADVAADEAPFQWTKQWYPVAVVEYLDPEKPHAFKLLGRDIVVWNDGAVEGATATTKRSARGKRRREAGAWRAFEDACPHRLAPLSEGRVEETGELLCAYHAWRFDGTGACTAIPQSPAEQAAAHRANPRAQCAAFPTTVADGLLWVWPEAGENAALEAATLRSPALVPELHDPALKGRVKALPWNSRELPYGWDFFLENVNDPAHVPVSHHGIVGDRYTGASPLEIEVTKPLKPQSGYEFKITQTGTSAVGAAVSHDTFRPPSLLQITSTFVDGGKMILALYATPSRPGYTNHIGCQILVRNEAGKLPPGLGAFALPMPTWLLHVTASLFLNQDAVFLHHQEKILARGALGRTPYEAKPAGGEYVQSVFTPNAADKGIIIFRQWLARYAGGGVPWVGSTELPPRSHDGDRLFDVYESHTKNCRYCLAALQNVRRAKVGAFVGAALIVLARASIGAIPSALLAGAATLTGALLAKLEQLFFKYEFSHASNH
ncbi:hypothetical protein KFE25_012037 [Diacronema lutheri]|uniref:Rieske domain-containing protein n=2 Tax=Diacronema lutheri TaxID=2081491 RepID=A0A8J6C516_DIALT|nr:hypothetical protein KFE25_001035 [Diacronema lutheri]KAG8462217.1 hypothetical protein KFE25_012037 [Diacronema lutheri]